MSYPAAPWNLQGYALQTLHLVDFTLARSFVPPAAQIVSVFPGKTLGGVYLAQYGAGSVLQYSELIVVPALLRYGTQVGPWISHIYVDNPASVAGGREIWGLPKELAEFSWVMGERSQVTVYQQGTQLCNLSYNAPFAFWKQFLSANSFSLLQGEICLFQAQAKLCPELRRADLKISQESPLAVLQLGQPWLTLGARELELLVQAPEPLRNQA